MLSFMHAQYSLFQQGYNLLDEIDPYMKKLAAEVSEASPSACCSISHQPHHRFIPPSGALSALRSGLSSFELSTGGSCVMHHVNFCFLVDTLLYFPIWSWVYCTWQASSLHPIEKLHYSLNHYFTHMLLWFKEFVTAAGIDASLWNTVTQCAIGACVCKWNMSHSASVNRSDSPVTLLYTACYVTRDVPFFIRTLNIFFWGFLTFSWISWWLIQRWRRGRWSTNTQPFSRGWVPIFVFLRLTK